MPRQLPHALPPPHTPWRRRACPWHPVQRWGEAARGGGWAGPPPQLGWPCWASSCNRPPSNAPPRAPSQLTVVQAGGGDEGCAPERVQTGGASPPRDAGSPARRLTLPDRPLAPEASGGGEEGREGFRQAAQAIQPRGATPPPHAPLPDMVTAAACGLLGGGGGGGGQPWGPGMRARWVGGQARTRRAGPAPPSHALRWQRPRAMEPAGGAQAPSPKRGRAQRWPPLTTALRCALGARPPPPLVPGCARQPT